ncbi:MAG: restriction endonuclease subunit M, partial [Comamonadaceae bacterium CG2_30_59_20]
EIAVFALALAAWRYPDEDGNPLGVRPDMPAPRIACCGLRVSARPEDWEALVPDSQTNASLLRQELRLLHSVFAQAPLLGSLLNPSLSIKNDLATSSFETLQTLIEQALSSEQPGTLWGGAQDLNDDAWDLAISARGLLEAARLLDARYHLVVTNVPYRAGLDLNEQLRTYIEQNFSTGKANLASTFLLRCLELALKDVGVVNLVLPQDWLVQPSYEALRRDLVAAVGLDFLCRLGPSAFREITGEVVNVMLLGITNRRPMSGATYLALDCGRKKGYEAKSELLRVEKFRTVSQVSVQKNPGASIFFDELERGTTFLGEHASSVQGIKSGDDERLTRFFWEVSQSDHRWMTLQGSVNSMQMFSGLESVIDWSQDGAFLARKQGLKAWGKRGVVLSQMSALPCTLYAGGAFNSNVTVIFPKHDSDAPALLNFAFSGELSRLVREFDQSIKPTNSSFEKVAFSKQEWELVGPFSASESFPKPYSNDLTQRVFHGHPVPATDPLQVAVARLLGYRWPAEQKAVQAQELQAESASRPRQISASRYNKDSNVAGTADTSAPAMELSSEAHAWIARCEQLAKHTDDDGIVCLPAVRGEQPAHGRLLALLIDAWETAAPGSWTPSVLDKMLAQADNAGKGLAVWLRDSFFEQHAKRFQHRPFIWHVWDGQKDGFGALVNAHKLDAKNLERLIHTYLGDWIRTQEAGVASGADGAPLRLSAAQNLKARLQAILEGEAPYDIFVRWKPLAQQPIGWQPDLNDGIRLNIRPFMTAEVLRINKKPKLNITWDKDRGRDVESAPWFHKFNGERINDHHLWLAEKLDSREQKQ